MSGEHLWKENGTKFKTGIIDGAILRIARTYSRERVTGTFIFCIIMQERVQFAQFIRKIKIENDRNTKQSIKYITGVRETKF